MPAVARGIVLDGNFFPAPTSGSHTPAGPQATTPNHPPAGGAKAPAGGRLGTIREIVEISPAKEDWKPIKTRAKAAKEARRNRYANQRTAASIWRHYNPNPKQSKAAGKGVTACGFSVIAGRSAQAIRTEYKEGPKASWRNLRRCDLRWVCPCCTYKRSEESRGHLNAALAEGRRRGLRPVMLTLTARHHRRMALLTFWQALHKAEKKMKKKYAWQQLMEQATGGFAKAVEITYGAHGWHPHFHLVFLIDTPTEAEAIEAVEALRQVWLDALTGEGLDGTSKAAEEHSFDVCGAAYAGEYVAKWGAAEEMTLGERKVGKSDGLNPWQLLEAARTADTEAERHKAAALWYEFVQVFKGVHQLRMNPAFKAIVEAHEAKPEEDKPQEVVLRLTPDEWTARGRARQVLILEAIEDAKNPEESKKDARKVLEFPHTDIYIFKEMADDIGPLIEDG